MHKQMRQNTSRNKISKFTIPAVEKAEVLKNKEFSNFLLLPEFVFTSVSGVNGKQFLTAFKTFHECAYNILSLKHNLHDPIKQTTYASHPQVYHQ